MDTVTDHNSGTGSAATAQTAEAIAILESHRLFLESHDIPCPSCRYNLRGAIRGTCPECGFRLELTLKSLRAIRLARLALIVFLAWIIMIQGVTLWRTYRQMEHGRVAIVAKYQSEIAEAQFKQKEIRTRLQQSPDSSRQPQQKRYDDEQAALRHEAEDGLTDSQRLGFLQILEKQYQVQLQAVPQTAIPLLWQRPHGQMTTIISVASICAAAVTAILLALALVSRPRLVVAAIVVVVLAATHTVWVLFVWP